MWHGGSSDVARGRPAPDTRTRVPVSAMARSTPVSPRSARAASVRSRSRSAPPLGSAAGIGWTSSPHAPSAMFSTPTTFTCGHHLARLPIVRDAGNDRGNHVDGRGPVEHAGHALELAAERLECFRPALDELSPDGLGLGRRMLRAPGRRGRGPTGAHPHLLADPLEELGPGRHARRSLSEAQRSWNVRDATGGRSRVRVHSPKGSGSRLIRPSRAKGRCRTRPAFAANR